MNKNLQNKQTTTDNSSGRVTPSVSFEFFPPKTEEAGKKLWNVITELEKLNPQFVSVTYGAGGSTRETTFETVTKIKNETGLKPAAHLTCVKATKEEVDEIAQGYLDSGVNHIVALRGDPPEGVDNYTPPAGAYQNATELVKGLKDIGDFEISVAAFPEGHPETKSNFERDLDYLKAKQDNGATRAISQYFLSPNLYLDFINKVEQKNIKIPVIPGIITISNFQQLIRFSKMCGASIPQNVHDLFANLDENHEERDRVAIEFISGMCKELLNNGAKHLHFYTLNKANQTKSICKALGIE